MLHMANQFMITKQGNVSAYGVGLDVLDDSLDPVAADLSLTFE